MDRAKATVNNFMSKAGHHDTTVEKESGPAVTHETVKPTQHEEVNTAVNREVHQDHYRHLVQPVRDREVLPEQHTHKAGEVINREFDHRDNAATERALRAEAQKLQNQRVVTDTTHTRSHAPAVQGEQVHHHVHEVVQPVIQKETVQPHVVHTTVPVHEVHHNPARHHGTATLPPIGMGEFNRQVGLSGERGDRTMRTEAFEGCPKLPQEVGREPVTRSSGREPVRRSSSSSSDSDVPDANRASGGQARLAKEDSGTGKKKPSLMARLNPMKDADGDGKKGFMS